jgi:hypothetical protein
MRTSYRRTWLHVGLATVLSGCRAPHSRGLAPDSSGCFEGAYPSLATERRRAVLPEPRLVRTQLAGLHILALDARAPHRPLVNVMVFVGSTSDAVAGRTDWNGRVTIYTPGNGILIVNTRVFAYEHSADSILFRAGYVDTLVLKRGYVGNECLIVPETSALRSSRSLTGR